jgi:predicted phosphodiesterase
MIQRLAATAILAGLGFVAVHNRGGAAETPPTNHFSITTGPVLQGPMETSMTVTWMTDRDSTGVVEYGPPGGELKTAFTSQHGLIDANQRVHKVVLRDLQPGALYRYRVVSREIVNFHPYRLTYGETVASDFREFRTLDRRKRNYSFLVFNDIHDQPATIPDLLKVAGERPYDFVVWNGDILSHLERENQITAMLDQATAHFASATPLIWVRGNHETRGRLARQLPAYLALPDGRYYYAFNHGPAHFIVLDTGEDKRDEQREYSGLVDFFRYRREQGEWLKAAVGTDAFRRATFRVVICHMPFASKTAADPARYSQPDTFLGMADAFENFGATLEQAGVDLMISGHMHRAAIIPPETGRHSYPIIQGGGSKIEDRTIIRVNVSDDGLEAVITGSDGSTVKTCSVPAKKR